MNVESTQLYKVLKGIARNMLKRKSLTIPMNVNHCMCCDVMGCDIFLCACLTKSQILLTMQHKLLLNNEIKKSLLTHQCEKNKVNKVMRREKNRID